jgi:hypothetical protein
MKTIGLNAHDSYTVANGVKHWTLAQHPSVLYGVIIFMHPLQVMVIISVMLQQDFKPVLLIVQKL